MKVENNPTFIPQSPPCKSYNPFDSDDEHTDDFIKNYANTYDLKTFEKNVNPLSLNLDNDNMSWEEAILVHSPKSAPVMNGEELFPSQDSEFTDKTIVNGEKENSHHVVKDIEVDEGLPLHDKLFSLHALNGDTDIKNPFETGCLTKIDESSEKESDLETRATGDESKLGVTARSTRDHSQWCKMNKLNYVEVVKKGNEDSNDHNVNGVLLEHVKESSTKPSVMNTLEGVIESQETQKEGTTTHEPSELPVQQASTGADDVTDTLSYKSKAESGNIVFDIKSSSNFGKEEEKADLQSNGNAKPPIPKTILRHEDGAAGIDKCVHGETSFSSAMPPPALITYMGANARCGSTSLRSESSTGSTRSFAFPVLQAEWNSSPVRMAKPDPRHRQKHRGWVQSLICCKF